MKRLKLEADNGKDSIDRLLASRNCKCVTCKAWFINISSASEMHEAEQSPDLMKKVEELMEANRELKDKNEELELNMLYIPFPDW